MFRFVPVDPWLIGSTVVVLAACGLAGCYSSTGEAPLEPELQLADLSDDEYRQMCDWHAAQEGYPDAPPRECPDPGFSRSAFPPERCMMIRPRRDEDTGCDATVADWIDCRRAVGDDLCMVNHPDCRWEGCPASVP